MSSRKTNHAIPGQCVAAMQETSNDKFCNNTNHLHLYTKLIPLLKWYNVHLAKYSIHMATDQKYLD